MTFEVVTLGEAMLRLSVPELGRLAQADRLDLRVGGAEANVAVALARLGRRVAWTSAVPDNPRGRREARRRRELPRPRVGAGAGPRGDGRGAA